MLRTHQPGTRFHHAQIRVIVVRFNLTEKYAEDGIRVRVADRRDTLEGQLL